MKTILLILLLASSAYAEVRAVIGGPETASPGDLVVLTTTDSVGDNFVWIQPPGIQVLTCNSQEQLAFAVGTPGSYTFTLIAADKEAAIDFTTHTVVVGPTTPPEKPTPTPTPTPTPVPELADISKTTAPNDPPTANQIVLNIEAANKAINDLCAAKQCPTVEAASRIYQANIGHAIALRPRGSQTNWVPWRTALEAAMTKLNPTSLDLLHSAYKEISRGLK